MMHHGTCLCGSVSFEVAGKLLPPLACHCTQCRRQSGHFWAGTEVQRADLTIHGADNVTWYQSSARAERGFCAICGSFLFWAPIKKDVIAVAMGAFASPTTSQLAGHIFVADKGDYYEIADGLPQNQR